MHYLARIGCMVAIATFSQAAAQAQLGVGARALGMGGAYTAVAEGLSAAYWNPAGAAKLHGFHFGVGGLEASVSGPITFSDVTDHFPTTTTGQIQLAERLGNNQSQAHVSGDVGLFIEGFGISAIPFGDGTLTPYNTSGGVGFKNVLVSSLLTPAQIAIAKANGINVNQTVPEPGSKAVLAGNLGFEALATLSGHTDNRTSVGLNLKIVNYRYDTATVTFGTPTATNTSVATTTTTTGDNTTAFAADLGVLYKSQRTLTFGAALRNLIKPAAEVLPTHLASGIAWRPLKSHTLLAADLDIGPYNTYLNLGAEYTFARTLSFRTGLYQGQPTIGLGFGNFVNFAYGTNQTLIALTAAF